MHKPATALSALLVLCVLLLAACGGSGSSSTKTATLPANQRLGSSASPPSLGSYAGMECTDYSCSHFTDGFARKQVLASCKAGKPVHGQPTTYTFRGNDEYFVCFTLEDARLLVDFYAAGQHIVRTVPVSTDRFGLTCDQGWCISGEWSSSKRMAGTLRNPNGLSTRYSAEWVSGP